MSSSAEYLFSYDNQATSTLSDDVEDAIMNVFEIDKRATYVSRLRDLALVSHSWTPHKRQHIPQEIVLLKPDTYDETLDRYIEAYNDLEKQDIATVALTKFPHILCIDWTLDSPIDALVRNPEFETFAKYYGRLITEMWIFNCDFASAGKLVWMVRRFPRLLSLRVADCVLGVSTLRQARLRYSGCGRTGVPWGLENVSISMRDPAEVDSLYDVMAFVSWLMEEPREDLRSVMLDMAFEFTKEYEEVTHSALYALGPVLVDVSFKLNEAPDTRVPKAVSAFPDLSANTRLKSLLFDGLAPGSMPSSYLLSTLSTVTSPSLERLTLIADIFEVDDTSLAFLGLDPLIEHLSSRNNFPSLKLVRLVVVNYAGDECPRGKAMWRFVHERTTLLRQNGVQIKYRLEDPHDAEGPMVYDYSSSSYEKGEYETEMDHEDTSLRGQLLLRSYEHDE